MTDNAYKRAMERLEFDKGFEERTLALLEDESLKRRRNRRAAAYACCGIAAACAVLAFILWGAPDNKDRFAQAAQPSAAQTADAAAFESPAPTEDVRIIVVSSQFGFEDSSYKAPDAGEVLITEGVRRALEDKANEGAYFFVHIYVFTPEQYANSFSGYVYNGRTIAEWRELVDLGKGEYPYSEYNMDHGRNITEEQFEDLERQAKKLDAEKNCAAAAEEYNDIIAPALDKARASRETAESLRLKNLGYDVFLTDTWTYKGKGDKQPYKILAGVLSKAQITGFAADSECGYSIDWVHNGDGVLDWKEYQAELGK